MRAVAAGHPATAEAGAEILEAGGSAADCVVAACLASCVAETVMTGLLGGGHAIYFDAETGRAANVDCFVAVPGLGREGEPLPLLELEIPFGTELVHYAVGIGSCGVPGVPAGLEALWRAHGRLPWPRLVEPALSLARGAVPMPAAHAACLRMLAPVMTMNEGARIYSPGGTLLAEGGHLRQPGLVTALEAVAEEGARSVYDGTLARALLALMVERGGLLTQEDLSAYEARWSDPVEAAFRGYDVRTRAGLSGFPEALGRLSELRGLSEPERALALVGALLEELPAQHGTTNISAIDADGSACVLTTSLGLGSGDFVPGFDLHLNSMLGEADLLTGPLEPGERMASMMAPTIALRSGARAKPARPSMRRRRVGASATEVVLAVGAAGGTRLRSALLQVVAGVLDEGLPPQAAVDRPRLHPVASLVHLEPGFGPETTGALESAGFEVRTWPDRHHYFCGVSAVTPTGAAGDPRRNGEAWVA
jgi:gamma-glutamyltranspeptidase / glutathione hydrolase